MLGKTHRAFALASTTAVLLLAKSRIPFYEHTPGLTMLTQTAITLLTSWASATLPDIDKAFSTHRGITHAIWTPIFLFYLAWCPFHANPYLFAAIFGGFLGITSHLVGDAFSKAGIAWFYPFQRYIRYDSGAFVVKGFRGPFIPLYEVGDKAFAWAPYFWYGVAIVFIGLGMKGMFA